MRDLGSKKVLIALPTAMLERMDEIASQEHRTRSDLIREALRRYLNEFRKQEVALAVKGVESVAVVEDSPYAMA